MKKVILSITLTVALLITSCSASYETSSSIEAQTMTDATTTTTESTTEATTTTTEAKEPISITDVCGLSDSILGKDCDTALSVIENAFATSFTFREDEYIAAGEDFYTKDTHYAYYDCDIVIDDYNFTTICFSYHEDKSVYSVSFEFSSSKASEAKECYEYYKESINSVFAGTNIEEHEYPDNSAWTAFGPVDDIYYEVWYIPDWHSENLCTIAFRNE